VHGDAGVDGEGDGAREVTRGLRWLPMTAKLREEYQYCNMMFVVASYVIEVLEGRWLGDILKERIWGRECLSSFISISESSTNICLPTSTWHELNGILFISFF